MKTPKIPTAFFTLVLFDNNVYNIQDINFFSFDFLGCLIKLAILVFAFYETLSYLGPKEYEVSFNGRMTLENNGENVEDEISSEANQK